MTSRDLPGTGPPPPPGSQVTPWTAVLPPWAAGLPPRMVMAVLFNMSFQRVNMLAGLLREQQENDRARSAQPGAGLVGFRTAMGPNGVYPTGEEERALVTIERKERQHCADLAMKCHQLGILGDEWPAA
jgi:hypothetical protein